MELDIPSCDEGEGRGVRRFYHTPFWPDSGAKLRLIGTVSPPDDFRSARFPVALDPAGFMEPY